MTATKDVFPADDPVARFMLTIWAVRNDIEYMAELIGPANEYNRPEFFYLVRLLMGHLLEGSIALNHYRDDSPEVQRFIKSLPTEAQKAMRKAANVASQVGGQALPHSRDRTFHYPSPDTTYKPTTDDELAAVLRRIASDPVVLSKLPGAFKRERLETADTALLTIAMRKHALTDDVKLKRQMQKTLRGAAAFSMFVRGAWVKYCQDRGLDITPQPRAKPLGLRGRLAAARAD
jgi:hypothetical protein